MAGVIKKKRRHVEQMQKDKMIIEKRNKDFSFSHQKYALLTTAVGLGVARRKIGNVRD